MFLYILVYCVRDTQVRYVLWYSYGVPVVYFSDLDLDYYTPYLRSKNSSYNSRVIYSKS